MRVRLLGLRVTHLKDLKATKKGALDKVRQPLIALPLPPMSSSGADPKSARSQFVQRSPGKASPTKPVGEPDVICLLDSDDEVQPQDLSELAEEFQSDLDESPAGASASHQPTLVAEETFPCPICQVRQVISSSESLT